MTGEPCRHLPGSLGARRSVRAPAAPALFEVGIIAADATLRQQYGDVGSCRAETAVAGVEQHMGEARLERQRGDGAAVSGDAALIVDGAEARQPAACLAEARTRRRIEERQAVGVGLSPQQAGQQQARQIGFEDLGRVMRRKKWPPLPTIL